MPKRQLIDDIRVHNQSASTQFLAKFSETELGAYLDRLKAAQIRHVRLSSFVRRRPSRLRMAS